MMKKLLLFLGLTALAITISTSQAFAFSLEMNGNPYLGPIQFKYNDYDWGTIYGANTIFDNEGAGSGETNSYGIFNVTQILGQTNVGTWVEVWSPTASEALEGWFYGLSDDKVDLNASGQGTIYSVGGIIEMYLGSQNMNITAGPNAVAPTLGNPPTDNWDAADGTLFLSANFVPGAALTDTTTTYAQQINSIANPLLGSGEAYLSLTGGLYAPMLDTNGYLGGTADLKMQANFNGPAEYGWIAESFDPVRGTVIPEPSSMLLFGMGMVGLATRLRRKKVA